MPMYMDIHEVEGVTAEDVAKAHHADEEVQGRYGVKYHKYWLNEASGKIFCLCTAETAELAARVHKESHGLLASRIIEVDPEIADTFMGSMPANAQGAVSSLGRTSATRAFARFCSPISSTPQASPSATAMTRQWNASNSTTASCALPSPSSTAAK